MSPNGYVVEHLGQDGAWWGSDGPEDTTACGHVSSTIAQAIELLAEEGRGEFRIREQYVDRMVWRGDVEAAIRWVDELHRAPEDRDPCWQADGSECDCSPCCRARREAAAEERL